MKTGNRQEVRIYICAISLIVVVNSFLVIWMILEPREPQFYVVVETLIIAIAPLLLLPFWLYELWKRAHTSSYWLTSPIRLLHWVPILLGLAIVSQSLGESFFIYYYHFLRIAPFPSWEDVGYLSAYPSLLLAVLFLTLRPFSMQARIRFLLDGLIIITGVATFSWYFILGPTMLAGGTTPFAQVIADAYPMGDLLLISCLILLASTARDAALRPIVLVLSLGLICNVIADSAYDYRLLQTGASIGELTDVGWSLGYMLYGLGGLMVLVRLSRGSLTQWYVVRNTPLDIPEGWLRLLPYIFLPALGILGFYIQPQHAQSALKSGVYLGCSVLIILTLLRQFIAYRETLSANQTLRTLQQELSIKNQELNEANQRLESQAAQVEAAYQQEHQLNTLKDQLMLNVNHELRTPLTAIRGYLELLLLHMDQEQSSPTLPKEFIARASLACDELEGMINNVLDAIQSKSENLALCIEELQVATITESVLDLLKPLWLRSYYIERHVPESLMVQADKQYLKQVLLNLLTNAIKYSPVGSRITISAAMYAANGQHETASHVCICVEDDGPGIPADESSHIFERFIRLKRDMLGAVRGTGLGLFICKQFVEAMHGQIWVEDAQTVDHGSRFCFTLPAAPPIPIPEAGQSATGSSQMALSPEESQEGESSKTEL